MIKNWIQKCCFNSVLEWLKEINEESSRSNVINSEWSWYCNLSNIEFVTKLSRHISPCLPQCLNDDIAPTCKLQMVLLLYWFATMAIIYILSQGVKNVETPRPSEKPGRFVWDYTCSGLFWGRILQFVSRANIRFFVAF